MRSRTSAPAALRWGAVLLATAVALVSCSKGTSTTTTTVDTSASAASASPGASASLPPSAWVVPVDVSPSPASPSPGVSPGPSQNDWLNFGWQTFVALNWPAANASASGVSGLPNTAQTIGASSANGAMVPTVWLTYRADSNTMLANAQDPGPWSANPVSLPSSCSALTSSTPVSPGFQPMYLDLITKFGPGNVDEASGPPLIDQNGWYVTYDIRIDRSEYTYIQTNKYYDAAVQQSTEQATGQIAPFPRTGAEPVFSPSPLPQLAQYGALEVKAAWRVLDPVKDKAVMSRYYTQSGYFLQPDGKTCSGPALFGLIGMHVLRLTPTTPATWFWATFEQVDNVTSPPGSPEPATLATANTPNGSCTSQYNVAPTSPPGNVPWSSGNTPVNVCRVTSIPPDVALVNQSWQSKLSGTVWANYEMINTINPVAAGASPYPIPSPPVNSTSVNTDTLSNTSMETYFQATGLSCMTCHAGAQPQGAPSPPSTTNQIFTFVLGDAVTPPPGHLLSATAPNARPAHRRHPLPQRVLDLLRGASAHGASQAGAAGSPGPSASSMPSASP